MWFMNIIHVFWAICQRNLHFLCISGMKFSFFTQLIDKNLILCDSCNKIMFFMQIMDGIHIFCAVFGQNSYFLQSLDKIYIFIEICNVCVVKVKISFLCDPLLKCTFFCNFLLKFMFYSRFLMKLVFFSHNPLRNFVEFFCTLFFEKNMCFSWSYDSISCFFCGTVTKFV